MNLSRRTAVFGAVFLSASVVSVSAFAAGSAIENSGFEDGPITADTSSDLWRDEEPNIPGWNWIDGDDAYFELGTDSIDGCQSVDTSDYNTLRDWYDTGVLEVADIDWGTQHGSFPDHYPVSFSGSAVTVSGKPVYWDDEFQRLGYEDGGAMVYFNTWTQAQRDELINTTGIPLPSTAPDRFDDAGEFFSSVATVAGSTLPTEVELENDDEISLVRSGQVVALVSDVSGDEDSEGYVAYGPVLYSDVFSSSKGRKISIDWAASGDDDDYKAFGYLLNVDTCEQTEVVDSTGLGKAWTTTKLNIPKKGNYRFVFVGGTYDQSWGGAAGGILFVDNIVESAASGGSGDGLPATGADLNGMTLIAGLLLLTAAAGAFTIRRRNV